ncbi:MULTISPECIES: restriction endonuclease subunit S [Streptococcus]|uniref:Type I restriction-modification system, specificity subunit S n=1 Tax=Streptococcus mitis TaxID=28037 RepID=A0A139PPW8_STRMT|nr:MULTISPECIES: restriction endonuclease subunit S [Streptococcus]KXT92276.1 Type I restriction-modification system, specificity subunit S [Streptococcus mitis]MBF9648944.1 restriction endonuclease subunit S [Streptococcus pseudopneumoniae]MBW8105585.1 restriction endonuclease subunit S [Streptococcus pseudopneumoniae]
MTRMKESGIDWIGQIPEEWVISKIKFTTQLNGRIGWQGLTSAEYKEEGPYLITGTDFHNGTINFETAVHIDEKRWSEASQIQVENGDLLITKDGTVGKVAIVSGLDDKASLNSGVLRIQTVDEIDRKFLYYVLLSDEFWMWFNYTNSGASTILHLYQNVFDEFTFTFPSKNEQQKIADFLDKKTAQLDKVKALLEEQIQKLRGYRASLIYETVTKGLDKTVPVKDSGIDWIGQVPEGWGVSKLKFTLEKVSNNIKVGPFGSSLSGDAIRSSGKWVYNQRNVLDNNFTETDTFISDAKWKELKNFSVVSGDILLTTRGTIGRIAIVPKDYFEGILHPCLMRFRVDSHIVQPRLIKYFFNDTTLVKEQLKFLSNSTTIDVIYSYNLKNIIIPIIPLEEQYGIVEYLDKQCSNVDALIKVKQEQIDNINKQRQTLIYDYVTGKRRV